MTYLWLVSTFSKVEPLTGIPGWGVVQASWGLWCKLKGEQKTLPPGVGVKLKLRVASQAGVSIGLAPPAAPPGTESTGLPSEGRLGWGAQSVLRWPAAPWPDIAGH